MTEYELADLFNSTTTVLVAQFSLYLTILSAYFATAYIIGNGLTRSQLFSISMIFIAAAEIFSVAAFSAANRLAYTAQELSAISSGYPL